MKRGKFLFLVVIVAYICIAVTYSFYAWSTTPLFVQEIPMDVKVVERTPEDKMVSFNVDPDALHFGVFGEGMFSRRTMNITNRFGEDIIAVIKADDSYMGRWITVDDNDIFLEMGETTEVVVLCTVPHGAIPGEYEGIVYITYKKA